MKATADVGYLKALLSELKIMSFVGRHPNVVNLLGACTQNLRNREVHIILEYCDLGDMVTLLRKHRGIFCNFFEIQYGDVRKYSLVEYENKTVKRLNTLDLIRWSAEIALGMDFLSSKNVIHGDLAGRNILITEDYIAKVSDFGLAKQLFEYSTYVQKVNVPLPLRWMAYESLKDLKFSVQSDIWSYGVVMWEIFSLGETPYPGMEWGFDSWKEILKGKRNDMPQYASDCLYGLMWDCWNLDPKSRPSFQFLWEALLEYLDNFRALDECC
jgi:serine/threonine protein kinase